MSKFLLYLFESGICLTLLYLVYVLFLQKETYFRFNRVYLLASMGFSLIIPLVHLSMFLPDTHTLEKPLQEIGKVRQFYTEIILRADNEFEFSAYRKYRAAGFEDAGWYYPSEEEQQTEKAINVQTAKESTDKIRKGYIRPVVILMVIYFTGVFMFLIRFIYLLSWLQLTIRRHKKTEQNECLLIPLEKDIPPFSFFRYVFIPRKATHLPEFSQVLAHEKAHVKQKHSLDLLLANGISIIQWFNPFVWQLQKAIKITHEYLADRSVVQQGYALVDYQSLLLSQLISIRSVALVNNFNLISIKKRIAMMTKNKSGFLARLKILFTIPAAIALFFLFAHMTVESPAFRYSNFKQGKISKLDGIWENTIPDSYASLIYIHDNIFSLLESKDGVNVIDIPVAITDNSFHINGDASNAMKYEINQGNLKIWWNENEWSVFEKTPYKNSYQAFYPKNRTMLDVPSMKNARILEKQNLLYSIYVTPEKYYIDEAACDLSGLKNAILKRYEQFKIIERPYVTTRMVVDKNTPMEYVYEVFQVLRELEIYKIGYVAKPENNVSPLQYHAAAMPMLLPPRDAIMVEKNKVADQIVEFSANEKPSVVREKLNQFITMQPDYIAIFNWSNSTTYEEYLRGIDEAFSVIYAFRDKFTSGKYGMLYTELPDALQKEVRKKYPVRLMQINVDKDLAMN